MQSVLSLVVVVVVVVVVPQRLYILYLLDIAVLCFKESPEFVGLKGR